MNPTELNAGKLRKKALAHFELGKLRWELGDFHSAVPTLVRASQLYGEFGDHRASLKSLNYCLRMFAEMEDAASLERLKGRLVELHRQDRLGHGAGPHYTLALADQLTDDHASAIERLERALALALRAEDKEEMCFAIFGLATSFYRTGRLDEALKELDNLRVFFQVLCLPDLAVCSRMLHGYILIDQKQYVEAQDLFWNAIENARDEKSLYTYVHLLYAVAKAHVEGGDLEQAKPYVRLAQRMIDQKSFVRLSRLIEELSRRVSLRVRGQFDLVLDTGSNLVFEHKKGRIDFKNQFILLDLLKVFLKAPGHVHSKESLTKAVWKQEYDPQVHDNKIYVTIKRLRQLIEPDFDKPRYIYRAKNGYFLNRNVRTGIQ